MLFSGYFDLPWWGYVLVALGLTHVTIAGVTIFLHRHQAHRALDLHPIVSHFFRLWLWMTTGMVTKEWAAVHRKHHAKCETAEDPHSPQIYGLNRVLWSGVLLYVKEASKKETLERYGHGTPDDWMERNVYSRLTVGGMVLMGLINVGLFGLIPGIAILVVQLAWIPFWAAGVINGIGHFWGYRNWETPGPDTSMNIFPWGILIGGEELHNNHHAFATSAKLSAKWYEFDIGWMYIRLMEMVGLATVKKLAPVPKIQAARPVVDVETLHAVIAYRHDVLAHYAKSLRATYREELDRLKQWSPRDAEALKRLRRSLGSLQRMSETERARLSDALKNSRALATVVAMRQELVALWERSNASKEQLVRQLQDWCHRADASGIPPLMALSHRMRSYA